MSQSEATLQVHLQPGARKNEVIGFRGGVLYARVTAAPENGKANQALIALLAEALDLPRGDIALIRGVTSRNKLIAVRGLEPEALRNKWPPDEKNDRSRA